MLFQIRKAPEITGIDKNNWINSEPLTLSKLRGNFVLLDFWTYSCINCLRTLPALKEMWNRYRDKNVVIIGIHTPEFEFERDIENVRKAVKKHGIEYPVASDPERINWERYGNRYWPRSALINPEGELIMDHIGESGYDEIEERIIRGLTERGIIRRSTERIKEKKSYYSPEISRETYAGSLRNRGLGSGMACTRVGCEEYIDPGFHTKDVIYPAGNWKQEPEYLEFNGEAGHIAFLYYAREVNVVMAGSGVAEVLLNNKPLTKDNAGNAIIFKDGRSFVKVEGADMYNLIKQDEFESGDLKIIPFKGLRIYAYTFG